MTEPADVADTGRWRIGELSRRVGVSDHVLRAWERRYGLLDPVRTEGGFRLYSPADEERVRRMIALLDDGVAPAEAARVTLQGPQASAPVPTPRPGPGAPEDPPAPTGATSTASSPPRGGELADSYERLSTALAALDEPAAQEALDDLLSRVTVETALRDVVLPYLKDLGDRWSAGTGSVAQEHFASQVVRGRLSALARGWGRGTGPRALLACPPGERHELALLAFGVVLARRGWAVTSLGADTPITSLMDLVGRTRPDVVVLAATTALHFTAVEAELRTLTDRVPLVLAGAGAGAELAARIGARTLDTDPVTAALALEVPRG